MFRKPKGNGFTPQEHLISIIPALLASIFILLMTIVTALLEYPPENPLHEMILIVYGIAGSIYLSYVNLFVVPASKNNPRIAWANSLFGGIALGSLALILPGEMDTLLSVLIIVAAVSASIVSERGPAYFVVIVPTLIIFGIRFENFDGLHQWAMHVSIAVAAIIAIETIQQLKHLSRQQINRLEIVNEFSRQIATSLNTEQVTSLLNAAIQNALEADTYYAGMVEGDEIVLHLFYDDGEFFSNVRAKMEGTLSGWVIRNKKGLFLPDLRSDVSLEGVKTVIIGKKKTSLSWMGVPMQGEHISGMIAIASYRPNAFNRSDMELLANMAQHAALALDNTFRHALVEQQTHLDSLTGVYNHGYFLKVLHQQAETARESKQPLSLIMLDVDYFKQYNDTYGHLSGDEILTNLCDIIRRNIKHTDAVGRWGGEEFIISLPNASIEQAIQIANRISETMAALKLRNEKQATLPIPTISQGIAIFPDEANDVIKLIDLADRRLYIAKGRGRNQIEPEPPQRKEIGEQPKESGGFPPPAHFL
jgi:diguanylate cyclase (GGDEF)-like protein